MTNIFDYTFIDNNASKTLVLLHGTGGSKSDFLFLDDALSNSINLLSLQGNILENGMSRFFKRIAAGIFDQNNIMEESEKLQIFIKEWCEINHINSSDLIFLGYSNGANMILATLFYYPTLIITAALLHPMLPFSPKSISLKDKSFFITSGQEDEMVSPIDQVKLIELLQSLGATIVQKQYPGGHGISELEMQDLLNYLKTLNIEK